MAKASGSRSTFSADTTNFARLAMCIIGPCTQMVRDILSLHVFPSNLRKVIAVQRLTLNFEQRKQLSAGTVPDYSNFDMSFLYLLLRTPGICHPNISPPTHGWGKPPTSSAEVSLGDDIERLRLMKNDICSHIKKPELPKVDFDDKLSVLKDIAGRFDVLMTPSTDYVTDLNQMEVEPLEREVEEYFVEQIRNLISQEQETRDKFEDAKRTISELETKTDQTNKRLDESITRIDFNEEKMVKLEAKTEQTDRKLDETIATADSNICKQKGLEDWFLHTIQEEDKVFIETGAYHHTLSTLLKDKIVSVIGITGQGKTSIAMHIAVKLAKEGYRILNVRSAEELKLKYDPYQKTLFLVDDAFGKHYKMQQKVDAWNDNADDINRLTKHDLLGIFTSQKLVWNECQAYIESQPIFKSFIDLTAPAMTPSRGEKELMLSRHLDISSKVISDSWFQEIVGLETAIGFPYCCSSFCSNEELYQLGVDYFNNPTESLKKEFARLARINKEKYCILLCVLVLGEHCPECLNSILNRPINDKIKSILRPFGIELDQNIVSLQNSLDDMKGCYLKTSGGQVSFIYDVYANAMCMAQGKLSPDLILQHCSSVFFHQHVRILVDKSSIGGDESTIFIESSNPHLLHCVIRLLHEGDLFLIFDNPVMHNTDVIKILSDYVSANPALCTFMIKQTDDNKSVLEYCFESGESEMVKFGLHATKVFKSYNINEEDFQICLNECLCIACRTGNSEATETLINIGSDVSFTSSKSYGINPLQWSVIGGHMGPLHCLLEHGANLNSTDRKRQTALHYAVRKSPDGMKFQIINTLLKCGANANIKDARGKKMGDYLTEDEYFDKQEISLKINLLTSIYEEGDIDKWRKHKETLSRLSEVELIEVLKSLWDLDRDIHTDIILEVLKRNFDLNKIDDNGKCHLHYVAEQIPINLNVAKVWKQMIAVKIKSLLDYGANGHCQDDNGKTPLHLAVEQGNIPAVAVICRHYMDVNCKDKEGKTPLHLAVEQGNIPAVEVIGRHGVDVNCKDKEGKTPLHYATDILPIQVSAQKMSDLPKFQIINILLEYGANAKLTDVHGHTAGYYLHRRDDGDKQTLLYNCLVSIHSKHDIVTYFQDKVLSAVNEAIAIEIKNALIVCAVSVGGTYVLKEVLNISGTVDCVDDNGKSPLHHAVEQISLQLNSSVDIISLLLSHGSNVNCKDEDGKTSLHLAVEQGSSRVVKVLCRYNADVNYKDKEGKTPLHYATDILPIQVSAKKMSDLPKFQIINILLEYGANAELTDVHGQTAGYYLHRRDDDDKQTLFYNCLVSIHSKHDIVTYFQDKVLSAVNEAIAIEIKNALIVCALSVGGTYVLKEVLNISGTVDCVDDNGKSPLHHAVEQISLKLYSSVDVISLLLNRGANVNCKDEDGKTPLHLAVEQVNLRAVEVLCRHKADVNCKDKEGKTPTRYIEDMLSIITSSFHEKFKIMKILQIYGGRY